MDPTLRTLLQTGHVEDEKNYTHFSSYPRAKWNIRTNYMTEFWRGYCQLIADGKNNLFLFEKVPDRCVYIVKLNLKFNNNGNINMENPLNDAFLLGVSACFQSAIYDLLQVDQQSSQLITCVLESKVRIEDDVIICPLRFQFPFCKTDVSVQKKLTTEAIRKLRIDNVVSELEQQPIIDWNDIVDINTLSE